MLISVIVCTRDRCEKLTLVLNSLDAVSIPQGVELEILIVDNGSADATSEVCASFINISNRGKQTYRYLFEGRKGKSFALNHGIREARGEILAFTDDDCIVDLGWLNAIVDLYASDPGLSVIGGRVELHDKRDRPLTLVTFEEPMVLSSNPALLFKPVIIGANMSFKKAVADAVGDFDVLLGPGSKAGAVFEDADYVYRAYRKGFKVVYHPSLVVFHNHGRQTEDEQDAVMYRYKVGRGAFYFKYMLRDKDVVFRFLSDLVEILKNGTTAVCSGTLPRFEMRVLMAFFVGAWSRLSR